MTESERYETEAEVFGEAINDISIIVSSQMTKEGWEAIQKIVADALEAAQAEEE